MSHPPLTPAYAFFLLTIQHLSTLRMVRIGNWRQFLATICGIYRQSVNTLQVCNGQMAYCPTRGGAGDMLIVSWPPNARRVLLCSPTSVACKQKRSSLR